MSEDIKIRKGLNIRLKGKAEKIFVKKEIAPTYAIKPTEFQGLTPKLSVKEGDIVKAGDPLFYHKHDNSIVFTSPVSGEVLSIVRGERRRILEVIVKASDQIEYKDFGTAELDSLSTDEIKAKMLDSGVWPLLIERPYGILANTTVTPKSIFISSVNSAPLEADYDFIVGEEKDTFQKGLDVLKRLTSGSVHLGVNKNFPSDVYVKAKGVVIHNVEGVHPAGNVGVHIEKIDPINKGETVWTINPQSVIILGRLFLKGVYDASKIIALAGSEVEKPRYYKTISGANLQSIIKDNIKSENVRFISGNVLTGKRIEKNGYVGILDSMVTVIPEGNSPEFFGWALPGFHKFSSSRTFFSWLFVDKKFRLNTNFNGGERAFVLPAQYEKVMPMNIMPVQLLKAIVAEDVELMEQLGIYEVVEEDFALCEYVCASKVEIQSLIRTGLDLVRKEYS